MAADWIKVEYATPEKPEVMSVSAKMGIDPDIVFACWFRIWRWADANLSRNGHARGVTLSLLNRVAQRDGIAEAFAESGWLTPTKDGVIFVNFDRHNGKSGKERALEQRRQRERRKNVTETSRCNRDKSVTRDRDREEYIPPIPPEGGESASDFLDRLWSASPAKGRARSSKKQVRSAWDRTKDKPDPDVVLAAMKRWSASDDWTKDDGKYVQGLHIWVKNRRWENPPEDAGLADRSGLDPCKPKSADEVRKMMRECGLIKEEAVA